jgi:hypothetical protein
MLSWNTKRITVVDPFRPVTPETSIAAWLGLSTIYLPLIEARELKGNMAQIYERERFDAPWHNAQL